MTTPDKTLFVAKSPQHSRNVFYPGCEASRLFARLCNGRQLRRSVLTINENEMTKIKALWYEVLIVSKFENEGME